MQQHRQKQDKSETEGLNKFKYLKEYIRQNGLEKFVIEICNTKPEKSM